MKQEDKNKIKFKSTQELIQSKENDSTFFDNSILDRLFGFVHPAAIGLWMGIHAVGSCTRGKIYSMSKESPEEIEKLIAKLIEEDLICVDVSDN